MKTIKIGSTFRNSCIPEPTISVSNKQKVAVSRKALCNGREVDYLEIFIDSLPYIIHKTFVTIDENELVAFENNQKIDLETLLIESRNLSVEIRREKEDKELYLKRLNEEMEAEKLIAKEKSLAKFKSFIDKCSTDGVAIANWSIFDESQYTQGVSLSISFLNPTKKVIKYIWVEIVGYDPVGEKVIEKGTSKKSVKCVGPIGPMEVPSFNFEYVWFTDLVKTAKLGTIKVQYMDNTIKTILKPDKVTIPNEVFEGIKLD